MSTRALTLRAGGLSVRTRVRPLAVTAALTVTALAGLVASVALGDYAIPLPDVLKSLAGAGDRATDFIVVDLRLPRALTALLAGAALGLSGAIFQQVTRNALVSPDVVGVAGGASLAAVAVIVLGSATGGAAVPLAALAGALVAGTLLVTLAGRKGADGLRIVLVGIGLAAFAQAGVGYVLTEGRIFEVAEAYVWMVGSVNGRDWEHVWALAATLAVLAPVVVAQARRLDALTLGDEVARGLGIRADRSRLALLATGTVLTGVAVSAAGPLGFVAFVAPHVARRLLRTASSQALMPAAAASGAALVLAADLAGRELFAAELPAGLITSILAAPYFLVLLRRAGRVGVAG